MRLDLEIELWRRGQVREVILLEAASEGALRKSHGRHFEDLATLVAASRSPLNRACLSPFLSPPKEFPTNGDCASTPVKSIGCARSSVG